MANLEGVKVGDLLAIEMNQGDDKCAVCGGRSDASYGVPMLEGKLVSNNWTGPWGGCPACADCYLEHAAGSLRTHDQEFSHYLPQKRLVDW